MKSGNNQYYIHANNIGQKQQPSLKVKVVKTAYLDADILVAASEVVVVGRWHLHAAVKDTHQPSGEVEVAVFLEPDQVAFAIVDAEDAHFSSASYQCCAGPYTYK